MNIKLYKNLITLELMKYIAIGIFNTAWGYALIFFFMYIINMNAFLSNAITYTIGIIVTYTLNRKLTFKSTGGKCSEIIRFFIVFIISYIGNLTTLYLLINYTQTHEAIAQIIASFVYMGFSFPLCKFYVYRKPRVLTFE